jgi:hypothetical protein
MLCYTVHITEFHRNKVSTFCAALSIQQNFTEIRFQHFVLHCLFNKTLQCEFDVEFSISVKMTNGNL